MKVVFNLLLALCLCSAASTSFSDTAEILHPVAIFDFSEKGRAVSGMGEKIGSILFAKLVMDPNIALVDREELNKLEDEAVLSLSGMVNPQQAIQVGQLTGAKIIITGTIFEIEDSLMIVAKIIGTETSRVLGASVEGSVSDSVLSLTQDLSSQVANVISSNADTLLAKPVSRNDRLAELKKKLGDRERPTLAISIREQHINRAAKDPAAETEMIFYSMDSGFEVVDAGSTSAKSADILIRGEGFTEISTRKGEIVGVKARLEVRAIDQATNRVIAVDRQVEVEIDVSEMIAAKGALQSASAKIAERLLPKLVGL
ncbi:CsgG/HfaB family protein [Gilvimarinus agarilyticus]|uniref:CsgG/HfaB family protein n=1 Tax=Gilvimarinus sp. 2_MG-2023 TaxID=3062666 RepID=UPI001C0A10ED|nr:CsgG/HfaB family protein [Gilvimarinus sp. 2_MG-2023]MBU2885165.1 CsgG/HfaB family protein [Gilvimarinus agarilyticus]MDO6570063.1 CsgG/HfaB family protein [Gilvimarinus sp. 2_MG-2023]